MTPEHEPCHWWTDPADGRRYFIPGCMGAAHGGKSACSCPAPARRRRVMRHHTLADDYAHLARTLQAVREERDALRRERKELRGRIRELENES